MLETDLTITSAVEFIDAILSTGILEPLAAPRSFPRYSTSYEQVNVAW